MKILIIGKGGREHALAWKLSQNPRIEQIYIAEGNAGCELLPKVKNIPLNQIDVLLDFAKQHQINLTIVGSEELLV
ncbi:MAG TPA: phosphoribosylamine--glycine ligase, partial [Neisseriales bacterium]|nr:phosphoribosylamine--glycine ligase [Neisseriales bacterium]